jgi:hypothetical protein
MEIPCRLMEVRDEGEGDEICRRLRAAGVKCAVETLPDDNDGAVFAAFAGTRTRDALYVLVNESDLPRARDALRR